ncbi:aspartyl protease family protein 1-like isoform X3 [Cornus florida]|uniref:aspartyl protease family protein 1-like isoform X3 n=1 Tax=Cornus florida TaxID=4283 RepID=UPI00289A269B|nr:aspartyl protease family protein 1-like isoform X3 [Cornus florida]
MPCSYNYASSLFGYFIFLTLVWASQLCNGFGTFGFDIHHRYSDQVRGILDLFDLPEKGSLEYYTAMARRDRLIRGRGLADIVDSTPLTFVDGNDTFKSLGYLYYANISVGTPSLWFLVALDTGSNLLWLPCDCRSCVHGLETGSGQEIDFNIYSPNTSSTSIQVPCNSTLCHQQRQCSATRNICPYQIQYLSSNTSSTGTLVKDVLHLTTDDNQLKVVDAQITFGCGMIQTGSFLDGAAFNGLFGLGMDNISVPSILASKGLAANSFSMCFGGPDGRISFGDRGSSDQGKTPLNLNQLHTNQTTFETPMVNLTMEGGNQFYVTEPIVPIHLQSSSQSASVYCLGVVKSGDINIIGQNFMTGYRIVFDRERMVLGWKASDCYDAKDSNTLPIDRQNSTAVPPTATVEPKATSGSGNGSPISTPYSMPPSPGNNSSRLNSFIVSLFSALSLFIHCFTILLS